MAASMTILYNRYTAYAKVLGCMVVYINFLGCGPVVGNYFSLNTFQEMEYEELSTEQIEYYSISTAVNRKPDSTVTDSTSFTVLIEIDLTTNNPVDTLMFSGDYNRIGYGKNGLFFWDTYVKQPVKQCSINIDEMFDELRKGASFKEGDYCYGSSRIEEPVLGVNIDKSDGTSVVGKNGTFCNSRAQCREVERADVRPEYSSVIFTSENRFLAFGRDTAILSVDGDRGILLKSPGIGKFLVGGKEVNGEIVVWDDKGDVGLLEGNRIEWKNALGNSCESVVSVYFGEGQYTFGKYGTVAWEGADGVKNVYRLNTSSNIIDVCNISPAVFVAFSIAGDFFEIDAKTGKQIRTRSIAKELGTVEGGIYVFRKMLCQNGKIYAIAGVEERIEGFAEDVYYQGINDTEIFYNDCMKRSAKPRTKQNDGSFW